MRTRLILCGILSGALTAFGTEETNLPPAAADAHRPVSLDAPTPTSPDEAPQTLVERPKAANVSPAAREIVQLFAAGTDSAVIQSYVETSTTPYTLGAEDVIYLHERGIASSIITAMLQRGAKLRVQTPPPAPAAPIAPVAPQAPAETIVAASPAPAPSQVYVVPPPSPTYVYPSYSSYIYSYPSYGYGYYSGYPRYYGPSAFYGRPSYGYGHSYGYGPSCGGYSHRPGGYGLNHSHRGR